MPAMENEPSVAVSVVTVGGSSALVSRSALPGTLPNAPLAARRPDAVASSVTPAAA